MPLDELRAACPDLPPLRSLLTTPDGVEIVGFEIEDESAATAWWRRLRDLHPQSGLWPVLTHLGYFDGLAIAFAQPGPWRRTTDDLAPLADAVAQIAAGRTPPPTPDQIGTWPGEGDDEEDEGWVPDRDRHLIFRDVRGQPVTVLLALIPAGDGGWDIPWVVGFGDFNESPLPDVHAAILRRWYGRWGAELFAITHATLEFEVSRPPTTRDEAIGLALEHLIYQENHMTPTLAGYAAIIIDSPVWVAWWD
jgi:hypothetical protein